MRFTYGRQEWNDIVNKILAASKLPVLEETPDMEEDEDDPQERLLVAAQQSPGAVSNVSGTTAVTQTTAVGGTDLDFEEVAYVLPYLYDTGEDFLKILTPDNATADDLHTIVNDLKMSNSKISTQVKRREAAFGTQYGSLTDSPYLDPPVFLKNSMKRGHMPKLDTDPWRPDDILFKSNGVNLARILVKQERGTAETYRTIRELDNIFPALFISAFGAFASGEPPIGGSSLLRQTVDLALEIRTQSLIMTLANIKDDDTFDPDVTLNQVFFTASSTSQGQQELRKFSLPQAGIATPMKKDFDKRTLERIQRIRSHFLDNAAFVDWAALEGDFPWPSFQVLVLDWVRMRNRELNSMILARGGAREIVEMLEEANAGIWKERPLRVNTGSGQITPQRAQTQPTPVEKRRPAGTPTTNDASDLALLKALDKRISGSLTSAAFDPIPQPSTAPAVLPVQHGDNGALAEQQLQEEDTWQPPPDIYEDPVIDPDAGTSNIPQWQQATLEAAATQDRQNREGLRQPQQQPQRRFLDPQSGATRVEFDEYTQPQEVIPTSSRNANGKRPAQDDDQEGIDPSQDVGFQSDDRNIDPVARRLAAPVPQGRAPVAQMMPSSRKRARFSAQVDEEYADDPDHDADADGDDDPDPASSYQRTKALARGASRQASQEGILARPTGAQGDMGRARANPGKRRWTPEQEEALIRYIEDKGCKWAEIKKWDDEHGERVLLDWSQVDIKDKAINMRLDFEKARTGLPRNFELITLRRRDKEKLESMGIIV
ncbi:hypothetical protein NA57DRAFT_77613 [Rhizodiscina lignyota]|uniref:Myb-like domain-containing protein n=1 Tax=Rhizodiscina lignyota TaxID=1504668 RepID=A0A9P4I8X2_9PEZI|nr:hypothetical protein NA57DRAFT_77613 [Rhizodiscina lignyota]